jgi:hypothetical protein
MSTSIHAEHMRILRRVKDPANGVVDGLALRKRLMTTFMCNNPESSRHQASSESVNRPQREPGSSVKVWARELKGVDKRVSEFDSLVKAGKKDRIPNSVDRPFQ